MVQILLDHSGLQTPLLNSAYSPMMYLPLFPMHLPLLLHQCSTNADAPLVSFATIAYSSFVLTKQWKCLYKLGLEQGQILTLSFQPNSYLSTPNSPTTIVTIHTLLRGGAFGSFTSPHMCQRAFSPLSLQSHYGSCCNHLTSHVF